MTNYNLEEFKEWLEEDESRGENLPKSGGDSRHNYSSWEKVFIILNLTEGNFDRFLQSQFATNENFAPYRQVALKWKAEVDQRERERERESKMRKLIC